MSQSTAPTDVDPQRSPTYPQRVHIRERAQWQAVLTSWDEKIAAARGSTRLSGEEANKLFVQMSGARDQLAAAVKRLPMEVGDLYEEDKHRLEEAVAALERLMTKV
ncbi:MAG: hypothetical protein JWN86_1221 [Planctomycetota bacterium]|nr:hypothetical protein [Planctomycetota bacterium]